jgi:glycerate dehydrogenase
LAGYDRVMYGRTPHNDEASIVERCAGARVVLTNKVPLRASTLARLPDLRLISVLATGYNVIDTQAVTALGKTLCNVPEYSTPAVAQHTVALILEYTNLVADHSASVMAGDWVRSPLFCYWLRPPLELTDLTVGIVGLGTIGRMVGTVLRTLGCRVVASGRSRRDTPDWPDFEWLDVDSLFATADIVTLHCPLNAESERMVDARRLALMKPHALLVNTARGPLVDEAALAAALHAGQIGGAALDVVSVEPMAADNPLLGAPRCWITPHIAWGSEAARRRMLSITRRNIDSFLAGQPVNVVAGGGR